MLYAHTHTHVHIYMDRFGASIDRHKLEKATAETSVAEVRPCAACQHHPVPVSILGDLHGEVKAGPLNQNPKP